MAGMDRVEFACLCEVGLLTVVSATLICHRNGPIRFRSRFAAMIGGESPLCWVTAEG